MLGHYRKKGDWQGGHCPGSFLTVNKAKEGVTNAES